jgi:predicted RNase H-like HicB family nuclease
VSDYTVIISALPENDGGGYSAEVQELPGCAAHGETREEALDNVEEAVLSWLAMARKLRRIN